MFKNIFISESKRKEQHTEIIQKYFLKIPVFKIKKNRISTKKYFCGIQYKIIKKTANDFALEFVNLFKKKYPNNSHKIIQVILNNLGEALIYAKTIKKWYKDGALIVCTQKGQLDIFKMYAPNYNCVLLDEKDNIHLTQSIIENNILYEPLLTNIKLIELNNSKQHFWKTWENYLKTDFSSLNYTPAKITNNAKKKSLEKLKNLNINQNKFFLLIKNTTSIEPLADDFWNSIENSLKKNGYDVLYNNHLFTIEEIYNIATISKGIISLRSGIIDILSEIDTPKYIIYNHNNIHGDLYPMYKLKEFPWVNHDTLYEYNAIYEDVKKINEKLLQDIQRILK